MRRLALLLVLAASLAVAGCLGGDGGNAATTSSATDGGSQLENGTRNGTTGNATDEPAFAWNRTTFEGSAPGPNLVVVFATGPTHNLTVVDGTKNLTINATSFNGEVLVDIYPPGCKDDNGNQRGASCSHTADTEDGGTWSTKNPDPGIWRIQVSKGDPGLGSTSYTVTADRLEPTGS